MAPPKARVTMPASTPGANQTINVTRVRFLTETPVGSRVRREFTQPRPAVAIEETVAPADLPATKPWPEPTERIDIVFMANGGDWPPQDAWMAPPNHAEAVRPVLIEHETDTVQWRPGRALVRVRAERREEVLAALTDFAFYESELRAMEAAIERYERGASADVAYGYQIRQRDRKAWARFKELTEYFAQLRLTYSRLEPRLTHASRALQPRARRLMARLLVKAGVASRLEALNDRLEAMEELYQGANDRVADFRWYRNGHLLEIIIIVLLLFECLAMSGDMIIRYMEYQVDKQSIDEKGLDLSEEFRALITSAGNGKISFKKSKEFIKGALGNEQTMSVAEDVRVIRGKADKNTSEVEPGEPLEDGLKNELFAGAGEHPLRAIIVTDTANRKVAEIYILTKKRP
jgi:hypothetical protein